MSDLDPLAKAEALLARYRPAHEPVAAIADFPVLTEVVEPPHREADNVPAASTNQPTAGQLHTGMREIEFREIAVRMMQMLQTDLQKNIADRLASELTLHMKPAMDEFVHCMASEIAASVSQECSRLLSEAFAAQAEKKIEESVKPDAPASPT